MTTPTSLHRGILIYTNRPNFSSSLPAALSLYLCKAYHSFSSLPRMPPHLHPLEQSFLLSYCLHMLSLLPHSLWYLLLRSFLSRAGIPHLPPLMRPHLYRFSQSRRRDSSQPCRNSRLFLNLNHLLYSLGVNQRLPQSTFPKK